jgi:hypothetical protein
MSAKLAALCVATQLCCIYCVPAVGLVFCCVPVCMQPWQSHGRCTSWQSRRTAVARSLPPTRSYAPTPAGAAWTAGAAACPATWTPRRHGPACWWQWTRGGRCRRHQWRDHESPRTPPGTARCFWSAACVCCSTALQRAAVVVVCDTTRQSFCNAHCSAISPAGCIQSYDECLSAPTPALPIPDTNLLPALYCSHVHHRNHLHTQPCA